MWYINSSKEIEYKSIIAKDHAKCKYQWIAAYQR